MESETILVLLFVVATAVAIAVQRLAVPYTVALVVTGIVLGLLHAFEAPHLTKALLFGVFLPGLRWTKSTKCRVSTSPIQRCSTVSAEITLRHHPRRILEEAQAMSAILWQQRRTGATNHE